MKFASQFHYFLTILTPLRAGVTFSNPGDCSRVSQREKIPPHWRFLLYCWQNANTNACNARKIQLKKNNSHLHPTLLRGRKARDRRHASLIWLKTWSSCFVVALCRAASEWERQSPVWKPCPIQYWIRNRKMLDDFNMNERQKEYIYTVKG